MKHLSSDMEQQNQEHQQIQWRRDKVIPLDACGIKIEGENKWLTVIQNASKISKIPV